MFATLFIKVIVDVPDFWIAIFPRLKPGVIKIKLLWSFSIHDYYYFQIHLISFYLSLEYTSPQGFLNLSMISII